MDHMEITKETIQRNVASNQAYESFEQHVLSWASGKKALMREANSILNVEDSKKYPPDYRSYTMLNFLLGSILTDTKMLNRVKATQEKFMVSREKRMLEALLERPAFWCAFTIKEVHGDDVITIEDLFSGDTHLIHSPALCDRIKRYGDRCKTYVSLMRHDGEFLCNIALLRQFTLSKSDLIFYCSLFADSKTSLNDIINDNYADFFTLDSISLQHPSMRGEHELKTTWQPCTLEEFDITRLEGTWNTIPVGNQTRYDLVALGEGLEDLPYRALFDTEPPIMAGMLARDNITGEMGFMTNSDPCHALYAALLQRAYPKLRLPVQPAVSIPARLFFLIIKIPITLPWQKFEKILRYAEDKPIIL